MKFLRNSDSIKQKNYTFTAFYFKICPTRPQKHFKSPLKFYSVKSLFGTGENYNYITCATSFRSKEISAILESLARVCKQTVAVN